MSVSLPSAATHNDFNSSDRSSRQDASYIWTQLNDLGLHEFLS